MYSYLKGTLSSQEWGNGNKNLHILSSDKLNIIMMIDFLFCVKEKEQTTHDTGFLLLVLWIYILEQSCSKVPFTLQNVFVFPFLLAWSQQVHEKFSFVLCDAWLKPMSKQSYEILRKIEKQTSSPFAWYILSLQTSLRRTQKYWNGTHNSFWKHWPEKVEPQKKFIVALLVELKLLNIFLLILCSFFLGGMFMALLFLSVEEAVVCVHKNCDSFTFWNSWNQLVSLLRRPNSRRSFLQTYLVWSHTRWYR